MTTPRTLVAIAATMLFVGSARAQPNYGTGRYANPGTVGQPTFSPYLNLLRGGNPALNYYGLVRPEREFRRQQTQFRNELADRSRLGDRETSLQAETSMLNRTGHATVFMQDLRGSNEAYVVGLRRFGQQKSSLPEIAGSRSGPTGHFSLYRNPGGYFPSANSERTSYGQRP